MKITILNFGCSSNQASAEVMASVVNESEHDLIDNPSIADVIILNTCTVKATTEKKILHKIRQFGCDGKQVIVTGCMPQVQKNDIFAANRNAHLLGINAIDELTQLIDKVKIYQDNKKDKSIEVFNNSSTTILNTNRIRYNSNIHICPISQGCNYECAYCIVRNARGSLKSSDPEMILDDIKKALNDGCREIWITSQDTGQYGDDIGYSLPALLEEICSIPIDFKVRVGMMNPFSIKEHQDKLVEVFHNDKIYKLIHLPIQSASNRILASMNRKNTIEDVNEILSAFKSNFKDLTFFTDVIVGFPGENDKDFEITVNWIKQHMPDKVNISRYTPRPGTQASSFRNLDSRTIVDRSKHLHQVCEDIKMESKEKMIGWKGEVFVSMPAKINGFMARTPSYKPVIIKQAKLIPGNKYVVEISDAVPGYFIAEVIQ